MLNQIDTTGEKIQNDLVKQLLKKLLLTKGIRLPMASTILRFRNPNVFQIIDQRAYRFVYGHELKLNDPNSEIIINSQIDLYFKYLQDLKEVAIKTGWQFSQIDRILYIRDQEFNKDTHIKYL